MKERQSTVIIKPKKELIERIQSISCIKKIYSKINKSCLQNSYDFSTLNNSQNESCLFFPSINRKISRIPPLSEMYDHAKKADYFARKLSYMLVNKNENECFFNVYSKIFSELADYFPDFSQILHILRKGLALSAINDRHFDDFEFKNSITNTKSEIEIILHKKQQKTKQLLSKLNNLSQKHEILQKKYEKLKSKYENYKQIIRNDSAKYIDAENLLEKMLKQNKVIEIQKNMITELKNAQEKLKGICEKCKNEGIEFENIMKRDKNTIINPTVKFYTTSKSQADSDSDSIEFPKN